MEQLVATLMAGFMTRFAAGEVMQPDWQRKALDASFSLAEQIRERSNVAEHPPEPARQLPPKEDHKDERPPPVRQRGGALAGSAG